MNDQRYNLRGVSASKEDVHNAIKNIDKGISQKRFAKLYPTYSEETPNIATSCTQMEQGPNRH